MRKQKPSAQAEWGSRGHREEEKNGKETEEQQDPVNSGD